MRQLMVRLGAAGMAVAVLLWSAAAPASAQQAPTPTLAPRTSTSPADTTKSEATRPGPRIAPSRFQPAEPTVSLSDASADAPASPAANHTITISTLTLVLVAIIVVLLIAR